MKVLFLGNSHLAAIKTGFERRNPYGVQPFFMGAQGRRLVHLYRNGSTITSKNPDTLDGLRFTSGGQTSFDCEIYDAFVLVGLYFGRYRMMEALKDHRTTDQPGSSSFSQFISRDLLELAMRASVRACLSLRIAKLLRSATKKPIVMCEQPLPRQAITKRQSVWSETPYFASTVDNAWKHETGAIAEDFDLGVLSQPQGSKNDNGLTSDQFGLGAVRLLEGFNAVHKATEYWHMNADYGSLVIEQVARALLAQTVTSQVNT